MKYRYKYVLLGFITIVIFSLINVLLIKFNLLYQENKNKTVIIQTEKVAAETKDCNAENLIQNNVISKEENSQNNNQNIKWKIIIPNINLEAEIQQGTDLDVLEKAVGHFENTSFFYGNIGLAAHNNTFFKNLKNVKIGDKIIYESEYGKKEYKINTIEEIKDTDWSYLQNTQENKITLITCVKNMPHLRLCVQGSEM